jgi:hypothetical protein
MAGTACAATIVCLTVLGSMAAGAAIGAGAGALAYWTTSGQHNRKGWVAAALWGGFSNAPIAGAGGFFGKLEYVGLKIATPMAIGAAFGAFQYLFSTMDGGGTRMGMLESALIGGAGGVSVEPSVFRWGK